MAEQWITVERGAQEKSDERYGLVTVTLNRADSMNAINVAMAEQLSAVMESLYSDKTVRCILLDAAGSFFMAGGDIDDFAKPLKDNDRATSLHNIDELIEHCQDAIRWIRYATKPVIARVPGGAAGYGLGLVLACDFVVTTDDAVFTLAYSGLGTSPDGGASFFLPRLVGVRKATELMMFSERFNGQDAEQMGLVNHAVAADQLDVTVNTLVEKVLKGPTVCYGKIKSLVNSSQSLTLSDQLAAEVQSFKACASTDDFKEGVLAFVEKRKPDFTGR